MRTEGPQAKRKGLAMRTDRRLDMLLILLVVFVWLYLLVQSVTRETRLDRAFVLDNTGQVVEVYTRGTVWEQGKGTRPATDEEDGYAREREERR